MDYYLAFKNMGIHSQTTTHINSKVIVLNEINQSQKLSNFVVPQM